MDDKLMEMARQAGLATYVSPACYPTALRKFAALVAADTQERCAKVCETKIDLEWPSDDISLCAEECAAAIRAMKD